MTVAQVDDRLVVNAQSLLGDRPTQHALGPQPPDHRRPESFVEDLRSVPAAILRPVQGEVRLLEQTFRAVLGMGSRHDAHADRADEFFVSYLEGFAASLRDTAAQFDRSLLVDDVLGQDHELVAPQASERVGSTQEPEKPLCHSPEHPIAYVMSQRIIDHLESIEV